MDNCEHLIESVASLVETVLGRCPGVRVLATSREALAVPGEVQLPVMPLAVPEEGTPPGQVPGCPAAQLFLDRAHAASPGSDFHSAALAAVADICRRLDGIPLALELAAARLTSLTTVELANHLQDRFAVLTSGSRTAEARQQTLRKTVVRNRHGPPSPGNCPSPRPPPRFSPRPAPAPERGSPLRRPPLPVLLMGAGHTEIA